MDSMTKKFSYCATLAVWITANDEQVKANYRDKCRDTHPDRPGGSADAFAELSEAYHALNTDEKRIAMREEFAFIGDMCHACSGTGAQRKTISFTEAAFSQCCPCGGAGYLPRSA